MGNFEGLVRYILGKCMNNREHVFLRHLHLIINSPCVEYLFFAARFYCPQHRILYNVLEVYVRTLFLHFIFVQGAANGCVLLIPLEFEVHCVKTSNRGTLNAREVSCTAPNKHCTNYFNFQPKVNCCFSFPHCLESRFSHE